MNLPKLNIKSLPIKTKAILITIAVVIILIIACICFYNSSNDAKTQVEIQKVTTEKQKTAVEVEQWKKTIDQHNDEFIKTQRNSVSNIQEVRKNTKPNKLPNYEKPIIKDASYNTMLDSLLIAQPD